MKQFLRRISLCSVAASLLIAIGAAPVAAVPREEIWNVYVASQTATSTQKSIKSKRDKPGQRTIIFVGGKKGSHGAAKKSRPGQAKKVNADLNPQPIPPGKQRQPK